MEVGGRCTMTYRLYPPYDSNPTPGSMNNSACKTAPSALKRNRSNCLHQEPADSVFHFPQEPANHRRGHNSRGPIKSGVTWAGTSLLLLVACRVYWIDG
ncbi:hypothetical protein BaRGS_00038749 [Batillaria attramentaria]|uniref:Uncharacterized protein n=1 Tax=Batillaria attramentaria TaxID=370345 RepID=A0ABD0J500_9CAEN